MISKLDIDPTQSVATNHCIINKINALIDAVNGILDYAPLEMAMKAEPKTPADPYAEQRKWTGCLVRYKICDWQGGWCVGVLDEIVDHPIYPFKMRNGDTAAVCEVVEPSEIYPNKARTW